MSSAINILAETLRIKNTGDDKYLQYLLFFFELVVPPETVPGAPSNSFLFPLVINPESYTLNEPFALETTTGQGGSLYAEENGIVDRSITLKGTLGWAPRPFTGTGYKALEAVKPEKRSYSRNLRTNPMPDITGTLNLSGMRIFQYLQDAVFRTYADLKADPTTSEKTRLYFHNFRDEEHWLVTPRKFGLDRSAAKRTLYYYDIDLQILGKAEDAGTIKLESNLLGKLLHLIEMISKAVDILEGAINDLTALVADIAHIVKGIQAFIGQINNLINAAKAFIDGTTELIKTPFAVLTSIRDFVDNSMSIVNNLEELQETALTFPETARQLIRQIGDAADLMGLHPQAFATPVQIQMEQIRKLEDLTASAGQGALDDVEVKDGPTTFAQLEALGTGLLPGDAARARAERAGATSATKPDFQSAFEISIGQGDTLANLAARYLGDARLWRYIAVINGLKPPFINEQASAGIDTSNAQALNGVLGVGRKILIPSTAKPPQLQRNAAVLGVRLDASQEEQLLGTDLALEAVPNDTSIRPLYDIPLDREHGSLDAKKVRGLANMSQAITVILRTELTTDILYPGLGVDRIPGSSGSPEKRAMAMFRISQAVEKDPRVNGIRNLEVDPLAPLTDLLDVRMEVFPKGFSQGQGIRAIA